MTSETTKAYILRGGIGVLTFITFIFLNGLAYYVYTTYVAAPVSRGVSNAFGLLYIYLLFSVPCLLMPFIKEHIWARTFAMLVPPVLLVSTTVSSNPKRVLLLVLLSAFAYVMTICLEKLAERFFSFGRIKLKHSADAGYGIALYLFLAWTALLGHLFLY